jgi:hypothetical protein
MILILVYMSYAKITKKIIGLICLIKRIILIK